MKRDIWLALRTLRRSPVFTVGAILSLAIAIGFATGVAGCIDALWHPLYPFLHQDQLYVVDFTPPPRAARTEARVAARSYLFQRARALLADTAVYSPIFVTVATPDGQEVARQGWQASRNIFDVLGLMPTRGRFFRSDLAGEDDGYVAVVSDRLWRQLAPGDPTFHEFRVRISGNIELAPGQRAGEQHFFEVIGVMPPGVERGLATEIGRSKIDLITPLPRTEVLERWTYPLVRAKRDVAMSDLVANAERLNVELARDYLHSSPGDSRYVVRHLVSGISGLRNIHIALAAAALIVILVACANIANLQITRALGRSSELAVRVAFGATRWGLFRLLLAESICIASAGAVIGGGLAWFFVTIAKSGVAVGLAGTGLLEPQISPRVALFVISVVLGCLVLFGVVPSAKLSESSFGYALKDTVATGVSRGKNTYYAMLVVLQVAASITLVVIALLLAEGAREFRHLDFGYDPDGLIIGRIRFDAGDTMAERGIRELLNRAKSSNMVGDAAVSLGFGYGGNNVTTTNGAGGTSQYDVDATDRWQLVSVDFFRTIGIPMLIGRNFQATDDARIPIAIVDSATAVRWWPGANPIGKRIRPGGERSRADWATVVGVSRSVLFNAADAKGAPHLFILRTPDRLSALAGSEIGVGSRLIVRGSGSSSPLTYALGKDLAAYGLAEPLDWREASGYQDLQRSYDLIGLTFLVLGLLGTVVAMIGIYAVGSYVVAQREREFGVRAAFGATPREILTMIAREQARLVFAGGALGLLAIYWLTGTLQAMIYDIPPVRHFAVLALGLLFLVTAGLGACVLPAVRASRISPADALRAM